MAGHYDDWSRGELQAKLALVVAIIGLVALHAKRPTWHALEGAIFLASLAVVWLGVSLAHAY